MSERFKSFLYLTAFIMASIIYYNQTNADQDLQVSEMASVDIAHDTLGK